MGGSSKKTTEQTQQTSSNTIDPWSKGLLTDNLNSAKAAAASLTPYTGQITAGFNPTQTQAQGILTGIGTDPTYAANNQSAISSVQGVLGSNPNTTVTAAPVTASTYNASTYNPSTYSASTYDPSLLAGVDLSPYENPYTKDVINASVDANERARQIASVADSQKATAAGAFGGSRSGVLASLTNGEYDRNDQSNIAALNQANFAQAQNAAIGDVNARNTAGQFNANAQNTAGQFNAGAANTAGQFNAGSANTASQFNAGAENSANQFNSAQDLTAQQSSIANALAAAGLKLNAAGQLVSANDAALNTAATQGGILGAVGDAQQQQQQTELTNAYNAYLQGQQLTLAQQQLLNQALGLVPVQQTVASSGSSNGTTKENPGLGGILSSLGSIAQGAAMFA